MSDPIDQNPARVKWDKKYREQGPEAFGLAPSDWLVEHAPLLVQQERGPALDIACGNGRNSLYLAKLGFQVEALDISSVAVEWLREQAAAPKNLLKTHCMDITQWQPPQKHYQVIVNFNFLERTVFPAMIASLASGGLLLFETFLKDPDAPTTMPERFLLNPNELLRAFSGLRVLHYREGRHAGGAMRAGIVARKLG